MKMWRSRVLGATSAVAITAGMLVVLPGAAEAAVDPNAQVVINEVYGAGGNAGAALTNDFVELFNKGVTDVVLTGKSLQYASAAGTSWSGNLALVGTIKAGDTFLVQLASGGANGLPLPGSNQAASAPNLATAGGNVALVQGTTTLTCQTAACQSDPNVLDLVGTGAAFAGTVAPAATATKSISRDLLHTNTAVNGTDFTAGAPTPTVGATPDPDPVVAKTIAEIQGTTGTSPLVGATVSTKGVVTAVYGTGGFNGFVIQTPGTGGARDYATDLASNGLFVFVGAAPAVTIGQYVSVVGDVSEFGSAPNTLTELNATPASILPLNEPFTAPTPVTNDTLPAAARESVESMLFDPVGLTFTVTDTFGTNTFGEVGLAFGPKVLAQPTDVAPAGGPAAAAVVSLNADLGITFDDGRSTNFGIWANRALIPPHLSLDHPLRIGATASLLQPVIVDSRNAAWKFQPTSPFDSTTDDSWLTFTSQRPDGPVGLGNADLTLASFNVLNYFTTLGSATAGCTGYPDGAAGDERTNVKECPGSGPRGAWDPADLVRQKDKIVAAINKLDADVVGLMEIENSAVVSGTPDEAVSILVGALNAAAGSTKWAFIPSSTQLPPLNEMDVINNAIIYQIDAVTPVDPSQALGDQSSGNEAFANAREPIAQEFLPTGGGKPFLFVVNHFKSKGSAGPLPGDADSGDGQGASNASRVAQANALTTWIPTALAAHVNTPVQDVFLVGDFNSYSQEDPLQVLYSQGYVDANSGLNGNTKHSYNFGGLNGSLDHVIANASAATRITGSDIWNINSAESVALEYDRFGYHGINLYEPTPFRSSDHDPAVVGIKAGEKQPSSVDINILSTNDFHGRIDANTLNWAATVESLRQAAGAASTLFVGAGDLVSASLFASAVADDQPTIDVMNEMGLDTSAVGNHEFDKGWSDLRDRIIGPANAHNAQWDYLGANVYAKGTSTPVLPEFTVFTVNGIKVGVTGAVTQETPTLVSPAGVADLDFGDPVDAINRVADQLSDGNDANGEADVIIATFHEGAPDGTQTLADQVAKSAVFAKIVNGVNSNVDVILNGHTHQKYAYDAPVPGQPGTTRPVLQTGQYGDNIGQVVLTVDTATKKVTGYTMKNNIVIATTTSAPPAVPLTDAQIITQFPQLQPVKDTVDAALASAAVIGNQKKGDVTSDITTAYSGGGYVNGVYAGGTRDDRAAESALGNKVADALLDALAPANTGGAQIGIMNPGGLRADLFDTQAEFGGSAVAGLTDGQISYSQANAILPFVNNLWTTTYTGAQLKKILEQQWQRDANNQVPTRPYLQLGLSSNFTYTFDDTRPEGDRITSMTINGNIVQPGDQFRAGTLSFLTAGGDNFREMAFGSNAHDSGLIDRDAWITYLGTHDPTSPSFGKHAVRITGTDPNPAWVAGSLHQITVSGVNLTSRGAPENTTLAAKIGNVNVGSAAVTAGTANIDITVPTGLVGPQLLKLTATPSGTVTTVPFVATAPKKTSTTAIIAPAGQVKVSPAITSVTVQVTSQSASAAGTVTVKNGGGAVVGSGSVNAAGTGVIPLTTALTAGDHVLTALYSGNGTTVASQSPATQIRVTFNDVTGGVFFEDVQWVATQRITTGYDAAGTIFNPTQGITRQATAAWLYRYTHNGADAPACVVKPAADIPVANEFCGEIKWMYDTGLTTGYTVNGVNTFHPAETLQRNQIVTFLFRLGGGNAGPCAGAGPFPDVPKSDPFCTAISWAATNQVTTGYPDGKFHPIDPAERQALAAFLFRFDQL
ncbi:multifunctional nuclease/2',3'-cyclic-nucleotide 2'-phosphodiesterase/5'-nucleotidase/3'-nucleotidase [Nakamurella silvestris]|nr:multifunctional nuclease/2',3'-cyclic-nucleotide 2'-phosphodiesterase/5'-nucleotidase/3'-nucleotidase [Nakamurella silvestris]